MLKNKLSFSTCFQFVLIVICHVRHCWDLSHLCLKISVLMLAVIHDTDSYKSAKDCGVSCL
jgi:hypothetical protein